MNETVTPTSRTIRCAAIILYQPLRKHDWLPMALDLAFRLPAANPGWDIQVLTVDGTQEPLPGDRKFSRHARARNAAIETFVTAPNAEPYDYVLWLDSDLVQYDADFPSRAHAANPGGITAPTILVDKMPGRFYDTAGFVDLSGQWSRHETPWLNGRPQPGADGSPIVELASVGCMYLAPASVYRGGARYAHGEGFTEHLPFCTAARSRGVRVCCLPRSTAHHAYLPDYGERWH